MFLFAFRVCTCPANTRFCLINQSVDHVLLHHCRGIVFLSCFRVFRHYSENRNFWTTRHKHRHGQLAGYCDRLFVWHHVCHSRKRHHNPWINLSRPSGGIEWWRRCPCLFFLVCWHENWRFVSSSFATLSKWGGESWNFFCSLIRSNWNLLISFLREWKEWESARMVLLPTLTFCRGYKDSLICSWHGAKNSFFFLRSCLFRSFVVCDDSNWMRSLFVCDFPSLSLFVQRWIVDRLLRDRVSLQSLVTMAPNLLILAPLIALTTWAGLALAPSNARWMEHGLKQMTAQKVCAEEDRDRVRARYRGIESVEVSFIASPFLLFVRTNEWICCLCLFVFSLLSSSAVHSLLQPTIASVPRSWLMISFRFLFNYTGLRFVCVPPRPLSLLPSWQCLTFDSASCLSINGTTLELVVLCILPTSFACSCSVLLDLLPLRLLCSNDFE